MIAQGGSCAKNTHKHEIVCPPFVSSSATQLLCMEPTKLSILNRGIIVHSFVRTAQRLWTLVRTWAHRVPNYPDHSKLKFSAVRNCRSLADIQAINAYFLMTSDICSTVTVVSVRSGHFRWPFIVISKTSACVMVTPFGQCLCIAHRSGEHTFSGQEQRTIT